MNKVLHEKYNVNNYDNDIAILTLEHDVEFSEAIEPICMPSVEVGGSVVNRRNFVNWNPFVAGWGSVRFRGPTSKKLLEVSLKVQTEGFCAFRYSSVPDVDISESKICVMDPDSNKDACQGKQLLV